MIYLLLSILSSTIIFIIFKIIEIKVLNTLNIIISNYFVASLVGFITYSEKIIPILKQFDLISFTLSVIIGLLFFTGFILIGKVTRKSGISVTSAAAKMSVVIPIIFSMFVDNEKLSFFKALGIILTLSSIHLIVYKNDNKKNFNFLFPVILFLFMGCLDSLIKYSQSKIITENNAVVFTSIIFLFSFLSSIVFIFKEKQGFSLNKNDILLGVTLGLVNFGSIFFLIFALSNTGLDSSVVFGINNLSIVLLSILVGLIIFKEKLSKINLAGIFTAIVSIFILTNLD